MERVTPLRVAAQRGRLDIVRVLVKHKGINLDKAGQTNAEVGFESPVHIARRFGFHEVVRALLAAGAQDEDEEASQAERKMAIAMRLAMRDDHE